MTITDVRSAQKGCILSSVPRMPQIDDIISHDCTEEEIMSELLPMYQKQPHI
jgi:hypothetical protein